MGGDCWVIKGQVQLFPVIFNHISSKDPCPRSKGWMSSSCASVQSLSLFKFNLLMKLISVIWHDVVFVNRLENAHSLEMFSTLSDSEKDFQTEMDYQGQKCGCCYLPLSGNLVFLRWNMSPRVPLKAHVSKTPWITSFSFLHNCPTKCLEAVLGEYQFLHLYFDIH